MSGIEGESTRVSYTVKELFARIDGKLDALAVVLDAKADHAAVESLAARVEAKADKVDVANNDRRIDALEKERAERAAATGVSKAILGVLLMILLALLPVVNHFIG